LTSGPFDSLAITDDHLFSLITVALAEDIGAGDITSQLLIPESTQAEMRFVAREDMVACGMFIPTAVYRKIPSPIGEGLDPAPHPSLPPNGGGVVTVEACVKEGQSVKPGTILAKANGPARSLLAGERVALNLMQRMCGVATLTAQYVEKVAGTKAIILDTRKTMPGLRALDKYAVRAGGGQNHRMGLFDMILIKDNHIALRGQDSGFGIQALIEDIRQKISSRIPNPESRTLIVVECDKLSQLEEVLAAKPDRILLDNMDVDTLHKAVTLAKGRIPLEASGGVSLKTVRAIAGTGVDYISVGKLTHSAPAVDIGADILFNQKPSKNNRLHL